MQVVDMIERRAGGDQSSDDLCMSKMRCGNQRRAVVGAGDKARIVAKFNGERHQVRIVRHRRDCHHVIGIPVERVHVRTSRSQDAQRIFLRSESRHVDRSAPRRIARVDIRATRRQAPDLGHIAGMGSLENPLIGGDLARRRRRLADCRRSGPDQERNVQKSKHGRTFLVKRVFPGGSRRRVQIETAWFFMAVASRHASATRQCSASR